MSQGQIKTRVGLIGAGYIAQWHAKALRGLPQVELVGIADCNADRAKGLAVAAKIPKVHKNFRDMLEVEQLDVVHLLVPPELHASIGTACLEMGVDLFLEKPMGISQDECLSLSEIAAREGRRIGVSHNYLFYPAYERLRQDVRSGRLGKIEQVSIVWNRPLGQLQGGPYHLWMFQDPVNILIETGPHSIAHALDLAGMPQQLTVTPRDPVTLPTGALFYRRWSIACEHSDCDVDLKFSYRPGFIEHYVHVRGTHGSAQADLEDNLYTLRRPGALSIDLDRYQRVRDEARTLGRQARENLASYVWGRIGLGKSSNPFGESLRRCADTFYRTRTTQLDTRLSAEMGTNVLRICDQIQQQIPLRETHNNEPSVTEQQPIVAFQQPTDVPPPRILVLGGTGFIGRSLVDHLVQHGHRVRVLSRDPSSVAHELRHPLVEIVRGNALRMDDVRQQLSGISHVYHLVTGHGETWQDYLQSDVEATIETAKLCLAHGVERFIYAGTIASLYSGRSAGTINGQSQPDPQLQTRNHYARAKGLAEQQLMQLHRDQGLPLVVLRPGIVVGEHGSPYHWGVCMWPNDTACRFWGSGQNPLPFVLVEDVAAAFVAALDAPNIVGRALNLVGDVRLSAQEYVDELQKCSGVQFDAQPHAIWKYFAADVSKWMVKTLIRHPERKPPSYRDWETRQELGQYDCHDVKELLQWLPNADRQHLIERGIHAPMLRALK